MPVSPGSDRSRTILIIIIVVCISVVTLYSREGDRGPLHKAQGFFLDMTAPVSSVFAKMFRPVKDGVVNLIHLPTLSKEKADLQEEIVELRRERIESKKMENELRELKSLLRWQENQAEFENLGADIIGQSPNNWQRLMIVNRGADSGVKKYMSVVTAEGLVGRIISAGSRSSVVQLITDSRASIGARDQRSRETGIIEGKNDNTIRFTTMREDAILAVGDVIETSGLGGTCPAGIAVGEIVKVRKRSSGLARFVEVKPFVKFSRLDKVLIIIVPEPESIILKEAQ
ncbi:MAG: rod shape-determining protein MreC [Candidatus Anoxymicrobium japonicum]|uniref:Cell shape-determining protein MreC n=1 Tax=Candidatus Anoxymicrobium japonicum TaxID=2013648 RepID=A0A2N3G7T2_9ACTN|nr:MAG: rod shape-determining protein MreC [Candidatus Anoxymicrobium japonicum]